MDGGEEFTFESVREQVQLGFMREKERLVRNLRKKLKHWYEVDRERLLDYIEGKLLDVFDEHCSCVRYPEKFVHSDLKLT